MAKKDGTENLGLGNCECTNDNIVSQEDREVKEDVQDDTKIGTQGGSVATGAIPKKRSSKPPNVEWANQTSSIINIDLVSEDVNARPKDVMVTGRQAVVYQNTQPTKRRAASAPKVTLEEKHHSIKHPGYPSSLINQQPPIHDSASCQQAENLPPPGGGLREAVSEEDGVNSCQENILMMGQDTNVMATSQSQQLAPRNTSTTLEENDITSIDGLVRNLKKEIKKLRENETELVKELFKLKHDLGKRSEELVHVRTQATMDRTENALLSERNSALERENEQLKECVTERETEIAANLETIRKVQEMLSWKTEECEDWKEHIFQSDARYDEAISEMEGLKRENQEVWEERQRLRVESDRLMEEARLAFISAESDRVKVLKSKLRKEKSKRKREQERNEKLFTENEQLKAMVGHLKSEEETNGAGAAACCGDADWQSFEFGEEEYCSSSNESSAGEADSAFRISYSCQPSDSGDSSDEEPFKDAFEYL